MRKHKCKMMQRIRSLRMLSFYTHTMTHAEEIISRPGEEKVAVSMRLLACCYTLHCAAWGGVRAAACISPRWMPEISCA